MLAVVPVLDEEAELSVADVSVVAASDSVALSDDSEAVFAASLAVALVFVFVDELEPSSLVLSDEEAAESDDAASEFEVSDSV